MLTGSGGEEQAVQSEGNECSTAQAMALTALNALRALKLSAAASLGALDAQLAQHRRASEAMFTLFPSLGFYSCGVVPTSPETLSVLAPSVCRAHIQRLANPESAAPDLADESRCGGLREPLNSYALPSLVPRAAREAHTPHRAFGPASSAQAVQL